MRVLVNHDNSLALVEALDCIISEEKEYIFVKTHIADLDYIVDIAREDFDKVNEIFREGLKTGILDFSAYNSDLLERFIENESDSENTIVGLPS